MNDLRSEMTSQRGTVSEPESRRNPWRGRDFRRRLAEGVLALMCLPVFIVSAAPAHGDPEGGPSSARDRSFIAALDAAGITYSDKAKAVTAGMTMCDFVGMGKTGKELVANLQKHNDSLTTERARQFMAIALQSYCPEKLAQGMRDPGPKEEKREEREKDVEALPWEE